MKRYIAGLDVGGTTGRLKLEMISGELLGEFYGVGCSINTDGKTLSRERYRALVLPTLAETGLNPQDCDGICIAASGIDSPELADDCRRIFLEMGFPETTVIVQNDCEIFLHLSDGPALVLVAGTGSICYGRSDNGALHRTGGWGHICSDEGSGFRIGMDVVKHIGYHLDNRVLCPVLYETFYNQTGIGMLSELDQFVNRNLMTKAVIGELAPLADLSYQAKEAAGIQIINENVQSLTALVKDTYNKLKLETPQEVTLWLWGSVLLNNRTIRWHLEEQLDKEIQHLKIKVPEKRALEAALDVARSHL